jgi:hypothetical protein
MSAATTDENPLLEVEQDIREVVRLSVVTIISR